MYCNVCNVHYSWALNPLSTHSVIGLNSVLEQSEIGLKGVNPILSPISD